MCTIQVYHYHKKATRPLNVVRAPNRVVRALSIEMILLDDIFESENVSVGGGEQNE